MRFFVLILLSWSISASAFDIIAHRGLPRIYPEHTIQSLNAALKWKPDYVEPDVVLSKDSIPVVLHDTHIDTTTNVKQVFPLRKRSDGRYYAIDFTLKELKSLKVNHRINLKTGKSAFASRPLEKSPQNSIPSLKEFLDTVSRFNREQEKKIGVYPEIKAPAFHLKEGKDSVKIVHDLLLSFRSMDKDTEVILQCFDFNAIKRLSKELKTPFFLVQLVAENSWGESTTDYDKLKKMAGLKELKKYAQGLGPWIPQIMNKEGKPSQFLKEAQKLGFKIHPYTLRNDALPFNMKSEQYLLHILKNKLKVDGIFTDNVNTIVPLMKDL
ncbi:MAG: glycerophosphodiester phosphodiesterase [Bdellovibrionales bacterium]